MKRLKAFLLALVLACSVCLPSYSEEYFITEEQLTQLELTFQEQSELLEKQNEQLLKQSEQIKSLQEQLNEASQSYKKSENKKLIELILVGVGCFVVGGATVGTVVLISGK